MSHSIKMLLYAVLVTGFMRAVDNKVDQVGALNVNVEANIQLCVGIGYVTCNQQIGDSSGGAKTGPSLNAIGDVMPIDVANPEVIRSLDKTITLKLPNPRSRGTFVYQITPTHGADAGRDVLIAFRSGNETVRMGGTSHRVIRVLLNVGGTRDAQQLPLFTEVGLIFMDKTVKDHALNFTILKDGSAYIEASEGKRIRLDFNSKGLRIAREAAQALPA